jgi:hypothetical protein
LVARQSLDIALAVAGRSSVDTDVLEVIVVAEIPVSQVFVNRMGFIGSVAVACVGRVLRDVQLVCQSWQQVVIGPLLNHCHVEVFLRNRKVSPCRIPNHRHAHPLVSRTEFLLVQSTSVIESVDAVTVMVQQFGTLFAPRVDIVLHFVAVRASPVVPSECRHIRIVIVVKVEGRKVTVAEMVHEKMDQPFPRRNFYQRRHLIKVEVVLLGFSFDNSAIFVLAETDGETHFVGRFLIVKDLDDDGSSVVDESLAGRLDIISEQLTELVVDEVSSVKAVVVDVVLHHSQHHHAQRALILKSAFELSFGRGKVGVCAKLLKLLDVVHHQLEMLLPADRVCQLNNRLQSLFAVDFARVKHKCGWLFYFQVRVQSLDCEVNLNSNRKCMAGVPALVASNHLRQLDSHIFQQFQRSTSHHTDEKDQQECLNQLHL